jgi:hypothetical protein
MDEEGDEDDEEEEEEEVDEKAHALEADALSVGNVAAHHAGCNGLASRRPQIIWLFAGNGGNEMRVI